MDTQMKKWLAWGLVFLGASAAGVVLYDYFSCITQTEPMKGWYGKYCKELWRWSQKEMFQIIAGGISTIFGFILLLNSDKSKQSENKVN